jgi:Leucine rich repeat
MNIFGIVALVIVVGFGAWFAGKEGYVVPREEIQPVVVETPEVKPTDVNIKVENTVTPGGAMVTVYDGVTVSVSSQSLSLAGKGLIGSLKGEVRLLTELKEMNISGNKFTGLPAEVGQLSKLEILNLSNNPLTGLPQELGNLKNLKVLDLRGTQYAKADLDVIKKGLSSSVQILVD